MKKLIIPVGEGITEEDLKKIEQTTKDKIKSFVLKHRNSPLYLNPESLKNVLRLPDAYLSFRHICMNCGEVEKMKTYAIAQTAMGNRINYTCNCGAVTQLPQFKCHKATK